MFGFLKQKIKQFLNKEEEVLEKKKEEAAKTAVEGGQILKEAAEERDEVLKPEQILEKAHEAQRELKEYKKIDTVERLRNRISACDYISNRGLDSRACLRAEPARKEETIIEKAEEQLPEKEEKRDILPKLSLKTKLKKAVLGKAVISEKDVEGLLLDFNLSLLESDVAVGVADEICADIRKKLVGAEISGDVKKVTEDAIMESISKVLDQPTVDIVEKIRGSGKKPFVIMFLGPNGHGKSTQIGKLAHYLQKHKLACVISASDTFRAAAIEQIEEIGRRAGTKVIKQKYGADPAAVAFDTIKYAEAHGLDVVLIDTAGRSELNVNLMEQLKKMVRVAKPDMKIYIGEALAGNAALEEARKFDEMAGIDGVIISKTDCDVKGGSLLSIAHVTKKPVLFIGIGQGIDDLIPFRKEWFMEKIV